MSDTGIEVSLQASATDFSHDLPAVEPGMLLTAPGAEREKVRLVAILAERFVMEADGKPLRAELRAIEPLPEPRDVRLRLHFAWNEPPRALQIRCRLFPYDPRHKTYLDVYGLNEGLERQAIFDNTVETLEFQPGARQSTVSVVGQFLAEGVHHIFIGPDHILFVVGLLLLGGTLRHLLKIVSAFTLAHSITLVLATLEIVTLPARLVESTIALSIVVVGVHALLARRGEDARAARPDARLLFAFGFGLIHGFGFASVLSELELPRHALGWSLFAFNLGVEAGQACIVLAVAPLLALLSARGKPALARGILTAGSLGVIAAGAFWFVQRVASPG
jgi:hydrogenase/urease accessory protein HupE